MKPLRQAIEDYIKLRRTLGFKLRDMADDLRNFAAFLERKAAPYVTTELAMEWAMQPADHQPSDWAQRLSFVRVFARHWHATDPRTEIPPMGLLPFRPQRARPYLYSELEIQKLLAAALKLPSSQGLRPRTYHCLFGLLAVAGLRISEALKLEQPDVDLDEGILTIRQTKFGKTRLVPLHTSTRDAMAGYARRRDLFLRNASSPCFFLNDHGRRLDGSAVRRTFPPAPPARSPWPLARVASCRWRSTTPATCPFDPITDSLDPPVRPPTEVGKCNTPHKIPLDFRHWKLELF
jgi:site-specific recombinase XerD